MRGGRLFHRPIHAYESLEKMIFTPAFQERQQTRRSAHPHLKWLPGRPRPQPRVRGMTAACRICVCQRPPTWLLSRISEAAPYLTLAKKTPDYLYDATPYRRRAPASGTFLDPVCVHKSTISWLLSRQLDEDLHVFHAQPGRVFADPSATE